MNKLKPSVWLMCGLLAAVAASPAPAAEMIAGAAGKTGAFTTKLTGYSAEGEHDSIAKRMSQSGYSKHDLTNETFDVYVPKEPGKDKKYGLIVAQNFREYGKPPTAWEAVLEKYHLIWIGPEAVTDGSPALTRIGFTLDAVYNAENTWPIDMNRVYAFNCSTDHPGADVALYFPEIFTGSINCTQLSWFHTVESTKMKGLPFNFANMPRLNPESAKLAKTRRYVLIDRMEDKVTDMSNDVARNGYIKDGYKDTKIVSTKTNIVAKYMDVIPDWFDAALAHIDSGTGTPSVALTASAGEVAAAPTATPAPMARNEKPATPDAKATAPASKPAAPPMVVPAVSDADVAEEKATKALNLARTYWAAGKSDIAKTRLLQVIKLYPKTNAAKDAKTLLDQITAQP